MRAIVRPQGRHWKAAVAGAAIAALVTAACGSSSGGSKASGAATSPTTSGNDAAWQGVIAAAKQEGTVTIYSSQALDNLNALATKFQDKYGVKVQVVRGIDGDLNTKVEAEKQTGHGIADVLVSASLPTIQGHVEQGGWFLPATGPDFDATAYNKAANYQKGDFFEVGAAMLTFGWNTQRYSKGLKDYTDLLDPALAGGKIGVIDPTAPSIVDFYLYLEATYGADFVTKLAAQKPRIYPSSLPMGQALSSGEIAAGAFVAPQGDAKATGAPVDSGVAPAAWGARFYAMLLKTAPHPNAAQLLADFMVTVDGQQAVSHNGGSVLANVPGTLTSDEKIRKQDLSVLTTDKVTAYQAKWHALFG